MPNLLHWYLIYSVFWLSLSKEQIIKYKVATCTEYVNSAKSAPHKSRVFYFNGHGDVVSVHYFNSKGEETSDTVINHYVSDSIMNKKIKLPPKPDQVFYHLLDKQVFQQIAYSYKYQSSDEIMSRYETNVRANINLRHIDYTYDKAGRLKESRYAHADEEETYLIKKYTYPTKFSVLEDKYSEEKYLGSSTYYFSQAGNLDSLVSTIHGGKGEEKFLFEYNEMGLLKSQRLNMPAKNVEYRTYDYTFYIDSGIKN